MTKTAPTTKSGDDNIQDMLPVACDDNSTGTFTAATKKINSFDEKTENSSALFYVIIYKNYVYSSNQGLLIDMS